MKCTTRIATGIATALALLAAPATYASEGASRSTASRSAPCACMAEHTHCGQAMELKQGHVSLAGAAHVEPRAKPSTPERQDFLRH